MSNVLRFPEVIVHALYHPSFQPKTRVFKMLMSSILRFPWCNCPCSLPSHISTKETPVFKMLMSSVLRFPWSNCPCSLPIPPFSQGDPCLQNVNKQWLSVLTVPWGNSPSFTHPTFQPKRFVFKELMRSVLRFHWSNFPGLPLTPSSL